MSFDKSVIMWYNKTAREKTNLWGIEILYSRAIPKGLYPSFERHEKMEQPNYYSIIPANVRYDKRITPSAKLLYAEITSLTNMNGECFSTNEYFANLYGVSKVSISKWVKNLIDCGYIKSEITYKEGSKEIDKRYLSLVKDPIKEKFKDNNTTIVEYNNNLTDSNIKEAIGKWVAYKRERKQKYTPTGLKQCIEKLKKLSNDNPVIAMQIVNESISNNWSGLFPLKKTSPQTKSERINQQNLEFMKKVWGC